MRYSKAAGPAFRQVSTETDPNRMPEPNPWTPDAPPERYSTGVTSIRLALLLRRSAVDAVNHGGEANYWFTHALNQLFGTPDTVLWSMPTTVVKARTPGGHVPAISPPKVHTYNLGLNAAIVVKGVEHMDGQPLIAESLLAEVNLSTSRTLAAQLLAQCSITSFKGDVPLQPFEPAQLQIVESSSPTATECIIYPFSPRQSTNLEL